MEELYKEGKIRAIGLSNFQPDRLMDLIIHNEIKPAINQIEIHPFNQQIKIEEFLKNLDVQIESWGPFAEGKNDIFNNQILKTIAQKYHKSVAQIILRWLVQRDMVIIPKSVRKQRMIENFDIFNFNLVNEDMQVIKTLNQEKSLFLDHRDPETVKWLGNVKFNI